MSDTIDVARIQGYENSVHHLSQQEQSRLESRVRMRQGRGKVEYFERLSPANMLQTTTRHGDTVFNDIEHSRRAAFKADYNWAQPVDEEDMLEILIDPVGEYAIAAAAAVGRRIDQTIVDALNGSAATGETGAGTQALPAAQIINSAGTTGLTLALFTLALQTLTDTGMILDNNITYVHNPTAAKQVIDDAGLPSFTSTDFTMSNVMQTGMIRTFLGATWVQMPSVLNNAEFGILPTIATDNVGTFLFHRNGLGLAVWRRVSASIDKRPDKNNLTQVLVKTHIGAVRVEDELVVRIEIDESQA